MELNEPMTKKYDYIGKTSEGLIRVKNGVFPDLKCGYINEFGEEIIPLIYKGVKDFSDGMAAVKIGKFTDAKWGFINTVGELIIPYLFDKPRPFSCGMAKVVYNGEWCFIDKNGNKVISLKNYVGGSRFHNGLAIVKKQNGDFYDTLSGVIDQTGEEVIPCNAKYFKIGWFYMCDSLESSIQAFKNRSK